MRAAILSAVAFLMLSGALAPLNAQTPNYVGVPARGAGYVATTYQHLSIDTRTDSQGNQEEFGEITHRIVFLELDYGLTDRLALNIGLPFKSNRYVGSLPHDPGQLDHDHGEHLLDDGNYHSAWGDWRLSLRYLWLSEPLQVTPFLAVYLPSHDYPIFAESAVGSQQSRLQLGVNAARRFEVPLQNLYWQAGYAYTYVEKVLDRRVNSSLLNLELGYYLSPAWALRATFAYKKVHHGLDIPEDFIGHFNDDLFYYHDVLFRSDTSVVGAGVNFRINERYSLFAHYGHTVRARNTHLADAVSIALSRSF